MNFSTWSITGGASTRVLTQVTYIPFCDCEFLEVIVPWFPSSIVSAVLSLPPLKPTTHGTSPVSLYNEAKSTTNYVDGRWLLMITFDLEYGPDYRLFLIN